MNLTSCPQNNVSQAFWILRLALNFIPKPASKSKETKNLFRFLSLYWYFHTIISCIVFLAFFKCFCSLNIFKLVVLKSLSSRSAFRSFSGMVSVDLTFSLWLSHTFLFLCMPCDFFLFENQIFESNNLITLGIRLSPFPRVCYFLILFLFI